MRSKLNVIQEELLLTSTLTSKTATAASAPSSSYIRIASGPALQQSHPNHQYVHHQRNGHDVHSSAHTAQDRLTITATSSHAQVAFQDDSVASPVVSMLSHREIVLNTVPYYKLIAHTVRSNQSMSSVQNNGALRSAPVYSERLDWMIDNVYNPHHQYTKARDSGSNVTSVAQAQQSVANVTDVEDVISDFD